MNEEKGTILLKFLKELPEVNFDYQNPLYRKQKDENTFADFQYLNIIQNTKLSDLSNCDTIGCVAGWTSILFKDDFFKLEKNGNYFDCCVLILELERKEENFLFYSRCSRSALSDAILRLEHLLSGGSPFDYDWSKESNPELKQNVTFNY